MATEKEIKDTILKVAGNPDSGAIKELADSWAKAIVRLDEPVKEDSSLTTEKRVTTADEVR